MAWILLAASTCAILLVGLAATALIFGSLGNWMTPRWTFWPRLLVASALTIGSLSLRSVRWIFLLRRAETRIPIRDAYIGYVAGFSLLFAPLLVGEMALRAAILRRRGNVPVLTTAIVNLLERVCDLAALGIIAGGMSVLRGHITMWSAASLAAASVMFLPSARRWALDGAVRGLTPVISVFEAPGPRVFGGLVTSRTWLTALSTGLIAWILPGLGLWILAGEWLPTLGWLEAEQSYAASAAVGGLVLAPGGVLVAGPHMLQALARAGMSEPFAAITVLGVRLATVGVSVALGGLFVVGHARPPRRGSASHFDDIADAYDVQIPQARRLALLDRKTLLMQHEIDTRGVGLRGLDVGCGQGAYVGRMRSLGFDVVGIDASEGQVRLARRKVEQPDIITVGSALDVPALDRAFDFLYAINVLHHLESLDEQRRAFAELLRVLKPGGLLFLHEINTRNIVFRFYMGYVFPSLNCIDEGVERWLLPHQLAKYTDARVTRVHYFTFLPDFVPQSVASRLAPFERWLERSRLGVYSAHYMAVIVKPPDSPA